MLSVECQTFTDDSYFLFIFFSLSFSLSLSLFLSLPLSCLRFSFLLICLSLFLFFSFLLVCIIRALELARPSKFLLKHLGVKKRRHSKNNLHQSGKLNTKSTCNSTPFFLTPIPSMVTNDSTVSQNTSILGAGDSSSSGGFFITAGLQSMSSSSSFGGGITKAHPSSSVNVPHLAPIQSAPQLHQGSHTGVKRPRVTFKSRFGSTMQEIQSRFDEIMEESDDIVERAEMVAAAKKAREQTKKNRLAKKGRRASVESTAAKQERLDKIEAKREAKRQQREKEKKNDKRKRAWSKAGASQKEVIDIISAFQQIDEDLTGEIDPKEFFALPQFSGFASAGTMDTLFRAIDRDGSGTVTVDELLIVMFPVATKSDVKEMIQMAPEHPDNGSKTHSWFK